MEGNWISYICPVCGHYGSTNDRFPICKFCKNDDLVIFKDEEVEKTNNTIKNMTNEDRKQYLYFEKSDEYLHTSWRNCNEEEQKGWLNGIAFREYLRQKYVFNSPLFDKEKYNQRVEWFYQLRVTEKKKTAENARRAAEEASHPRCPKCGCTEFQMVPRKWSPLTGFLTNKVDRVCVKCKTRF